MISLNAIADSIRAATSEDELASAYGHLVRRIGPKRSVEVWPGRTNYDMRPTDLSALADAVESLAPPHSPTPVVVTLEDHEIMYAQMVAALRHTQDLREKKTPRFGDPNKMLWFNTIGCFGEMSVAKHLGLYWNGALGNYAAADVGHSIQVRTSSSDNSLSIYDWDKGAWYVAVVGVAPKLRIIGCFMREFAQVSEFESREHGKVIHKIPQHRLWSIDNLPALVCRPRSQHASS